MKFHPSRRRRGFTFTETLVALVVLLIGALGVMKMMPVSLQGSFEASMRARAALLAQKKVEELRRDGTLSDSYINDIAALTVPTSPASFPEDDRITYSFSGNSLLYPTPIPGNPASAQGVPRVIVRYAQDFRTDQQVLYELRFVGPGTP